MTPSLTTAGSADRSQEERHREFLHHIQDAGKQISRYEALVWLGHCASLRKIEEWTTNALALEIEIRQAPDAILPIIKTSPSYFISNPLSLHAILFPVRHKPRSIISLLHAHLIV